MTTELVDYGAGLVAHVAPGRGEKVLWIHGYTLDATSWREVWSHLPGYDHVGIDLPGHGRSAPFSPKQTLPQLGRAIGATALEWGVRHVVGLSFGGMVALQVAIEFPSAFASLTLGAPALGNGPQDPAVATLYGKLIRVYRMLGVGPWLTELWMTGDGSPFAGMGSHPGRGRMLKTLVDQHPWHELDGDVMHHLNRHPQTPDALNRITAATQVLVGDQELPAFKTIARQLEARIPGCRRVLLRGGVHHLCFLQVPDRSAGLIDRHIRQALRAFQELTT